MKPDLLAIQAERRILLLRGQKVMLNFDLAELYGVETKALNRAMKRNRERFPDDFAFQLTPEEDEALRYQLAPQSQRSPVKHSLHRAKRPRRAGSSPSPPP